MPDLKEINPKKIRVGDYYIQEMETITLIKVRTQRDKDKIFGRIIYVLRPKKIKGFTSFKIGQTGFLYYDACVNIKFYKLSKSDAFYYQL